MLGQGHARMSGVTRTAALVSTHTDSHSDCGSWVEVRKSCFLGVSNRRGTAASPSQEVISSDGSACPQVAGSVTHPETRRWPSRLRHDAELARTEAHVFAEESGHLHSPNKAVATVQHRWNCGRRRRRAREMTPALSRPCCMVLRARQGSEQCGGAPGPPPRTHSSAMGLALHTAG